MSTSGEGEDEEYTFVEKAQNDENVSAETSEGTSEVQKDKAGEEEHNMAEKDTDSDSEMPKLETIDSEAFELVSSGLRQRHPGAGCHGPCNAACGGMFDPLDMREDNSFEAEYARVNRDLDEEPANLQRWRAWLSMFFLVVITGPSIAAFFLTAKEWVDPLVRSVPADDAEQVKDIFFGGTAWLVSCISNKSATKAPRVLEQAAEVLRPRGVRVARVHCWHPLDTKKGKRTLAQRFGFRDKPPVVMATAGKGTPTFLAATGLPAEALAAKVLAAVIPDAGELPQASIKEGKRKRDPSKRVDSVGRRPKDMEEGPNPEVEDSPEVMQEEEDVNLDET